MSSVLPPGSPPVVRSLADHIAKELRREIMMGAIPPGTWLRQDQLAERFGGSAIPVREGLRTLAAEGIVQMFPHRGARVTELSAQELREIYEVRAILESQAARRALPNLSAEDLRELEGYVQLMDGDAHDVLQIIETNYRFHRCLYQRAGNTRLMRTIENLRASTQHYLHAYIRLLGRMPDAQSDHRAMVEACRNRDEDRLEQVTYRHLIQVGEALADYVETTEGRDERGEQNG